LAVSAAETDTQASHKPRIVKAQRMFLLIIDVLSKYLRESQLSGKSSFASVAYPPVHA
jgi:hypothetical protein